MTEIKLFMDHFYILEDGRVRQFLIVGEQQALLIDTGFEDSGVYQAVREVTDLPVQVLLTHGDRDHTGGLKDFGSCYLNQKDWHLLDSGIEVKDLREGDVFRCGDFCLEVLEIPDILTEALPFWTGKRSCCCPGIPSRRKALSLCSARTGIWTFILRARKNSVASQIRQ